MKNRLFGHQKAIMTRVVILGFVSILGMLLFETVFNVKAIATANLTPENLNIEDFYCDDVEVAVSENGVHIVKDSNQTVLVYYNALNAELKTVEVELEGKGLVTEKIQIMDEANAYSYSTEYETTCVPDDPFLQKSYALIRSAGEASDLCLRLETILASDFTIRSVTINAPIPFVWEPLRMLFSFLACFAVLCVLFLRGFSTTYNFHRRTHRLIIIIPLLGMMIFSYFAAAWIEPDTLPLTGLPDKEASQKMFYSGYVRLFEALQQGRLSLSEKPSEELLDLGNPYDASERIANGVPYMNDFALYNNQYYIYFGLAPIITVYAPFHALTGRVPTHRDVSLLLGWLSIIFIGWAVCGLARRYSPDVNVFMLSLACVATVFATTTMTLIVSATFYHIAGLSFICYSAGSIAFGLHASEQKKRWMGIVQYVFSAICFVLAAMSRANALPLLFVFLAPLFVFDLIRKRARVKEAVAFLIPALAGVGVILWYNAARFQSVFDFGATWQLTFSDIHYNDVSLLDLPNAIYYYLLRPLSFMDEFPYFTIDPTSVKTAGHLLFTDTSAGVFIFPLTWGLLLMPLSTPRSQNDSLLIIRERRWVYFLPIIMSIPLVLVSYGLAGASFRYSCDYRLIYSLIGAGCMLSAMSRYSNRYEKAVSVFCVALCIGTIVLGLCLMFKNEKNFIQLYSPQIFYHIQRTLFPY